MRLFVLGVPRSGTTAVGHFIGSHPLCCDLGEYYGFYLSLWQAPQMIHRVPGTAKSAYLERIFAASRDFADERRDAHGARMWCDQTPLNLRIAQELAIRLPDAVFLLMLRHYRGTIQSLRRSYADGYQWAGRQLQDSAILWANYYENALYLPPERTIAISYDRLCAFPEETILSIERQISQRFGIDPTGFDRATFATSHATSGIRNTIAAANNSAIQFQPIASYEKERWSEGMETATLMYASDTDALLRQRYPNVYIEPSHLGLELQSPK